MKTTCGLQETSIILSSFLLWIPPSNAIARNLSRDTESPTNMDLLMIHEDSLIWCLKISKSSFRLLSSNGKSIHQQAKVPQANHPFAGEGTQRKRHLLHPERQHRNPSYVSTRIMTYTKTEIVNMISVAEADEHIRTLHEDAYGQLWIGTSRNLYPVLPVKS